MNNISANLSTKNPNIGVPTSALMLPALLYKSGNRLWYSFTIPYTVLGNYIRTNSVKKKNQVVIKKDIKNRFLDRDHKNDIKKYLMEESNFTIPPITLVSYNELIFKPYEFENTDQLKLLMNNLHYTVQ